MTDPLDRRLDQLTAAELDELLSLNELRRALDRIVGDLDDLRGLIGDVKSLAVAVKTTTVDLLARSETTMGALDDLRATDADLAGAVTDLTRAVGTLSTSVDRIDADFAALEEKVAAGVDPADLQVEVTALRQTIDEAKAATATVTEAQGRIDATDPAAPTA